MCQLYEYHFIDEEMTWAEAQKYCKENHTDLATVFDKTDMERLLNSTETPAGAWIGLHSNPGRNRMWRWSLPGLEYSDREAQWHVGEPNDVRYPENCVSINHHKLWYDDHCQQKLPFICYDGENM